MFFHTSDRPRTSRELEGVLNCLEHKLHLEVRVDAMDPNHFVYPPKLHIEKSNFFELTRNFKLLKHEHFVIFTDFDLFE